MISERSKDPEANGLPRWALYEVDKDKAILVDVMHLDDGTWSRRNSELHLRHLYAALVPCPWFGGAYLPGKVISEAFGAWLIGSFLPGAKSPPTGDALAGLIFMVRVPSKKS